MGRKKRRPKKDTDVKFHFKRRMAGRFNLDITDDDINDIVQMIQTGKSEIVEKQSNSRTIHQIKYKNHKINIVYDRERKLPVTAMYEDKLWDDIMYGYDVKRG